jgi:hypothetical protein
VTAKSIASLGAVIIFCQSCSRPNHHEMVPVTEKSFASGGNIEMQLAGGNYTIRGAPGGQIRVVFGGNTGDATAELTAEGTRANLAVKDTPHNDFTASIEVPAASNLVIHLSAGNLDMAGITGNKDVESGAGNVEIAVGDPDDYSAADGSVKAGDIDARVFGKSESGLNPHFTWQGHGKYTLHTTLGAGNLILKGK